MTERKIMNWDGKVDGDSPLERLFQLWTSWRIWLGWAVVMVAVYVTPSFGLDGYHTGMGVGMLAIVAFQKLIDGAFE